MSAIRSALDPMAMYGVVAAAVDAPPTLRVAAAFAELARAI
ncbi:hypothetical protein [Micromonospora fulviviridis]